MTQQRSKFRSYLLLAMACLLTVLPINQPSQKAPAAQNRTSDTRVSGQAYATLRTEQKHLVDDYAWRINQVTGSQMLPEQVYDAARMSLRTTFDACTHALLTTKLTNDKGQNLGSALDLVDAVDDVLGEEPGQRGDRQFRMYVYLKPNAFEVLVDSREFFRDRNNTFYHKGNPRRSCFRFLGTNVCPTLTIARTNFPRRCLTDT